ncbi:hypothetical protein OROGR_023736 [Orobanche gracilis]
MQHLHILLHSNTWILLKKYPILHLNPCSYTKRDSPNIIFLDVAITGFFYAISPETYKNSDALSAKHTYEFLGKWLKKHPNSSSDPLYVIGVSYLGITILIIVQEIFKGNEAGNEPRIKIEPGVFGNPLTDRNIDFNAEIICSSNGTSFE